MNEFNLFQLDIVVREYLTAKYNATFNQGDTLRNEVSGILYCLAVDYGIALSSTLLPSIRRICKGADNINEEIFGKKTKGKFPILNPILEAMLKVATPDERWAALLAQRFCLRSQHYCNNDRHPTPADESDVDKDAPPPKHLQLKDLRFFPNIDNPTALTILTRYDKNNPNRSHMERTVYCSCHTPWTCIVHEAQKRFKHHHWSLDSALAQCRKGDMYYSAMRSIVNTLITKIGLDPRNYGTHSFRSGGTSELYIEGRSAIFIKNFCWWKNIGSIFIYIKPNNPDLYKFVSSYTTYRESRLRESGLSDKIDQHWEAMWNEVNKQQKKVRRQRRNASRQSQAAQIHGPVRAPLNRSTFQNRLPMNNSGPHIGPAAQLASRGRVMHRYNHPPQQYTDYRRISQSQRNERKNCSYRSSQPDRFNPLNKNNFSNQRVSHHVSAPVQRAPSTKPWVQTSVGLQQNPFK